MLTVLNEVKSVKRLSRHPFWAVIILRIFKCSHSSKSQSCWPLVLCSPAIREANTNMHVGAVFPIKYLDCGGPPQVHYKLKYFTSVVRSSYLRWKNWKNVLHYLCFSPHSPEWIGSRELWLLLRLHLTGWAFCSAEPDENYSPHHLHLSWENTDNQVTGILSQAIGHLRVWEILWRNIILCKSQTVNNTSQAI